MKSKYPKAYDILKQDNSYFYFTKRNNTAKEFRDTMQLFLPEGTNIFANVTIPAEYAVDGKKHEAHSYEEFAKYYKEEK